MDNILQEVATLTPSMYHIEPDTDVSPWQQEIILHPFTLGFLGLPSTIQENASKTNTITQLPAAQETASPSVIR